MNASSPGSSRSTHSPTTRTTAHPTATAPHTSGPCHGRTMAVAPSSHTQATAVAIHPTSAHSRTIHISAERMCPPRTGVPNAHPGELYGRN